MENSTLGNNFLVDIGARIEGQTHGLTSESGEKVLNDMNL